MRSFSQKVLLNHAREYVEKYHPLLIGVAGRLNQTLAKEAIALVLAKERAVHSMRMPYAGLLSVVTSLLSVDHASVKKSWWRLLIGSRIREAVESEPDTHIVELGPKQPGEIDEVVNSFPFFIGVITGVPSRSLELFVDKKTVAHELQSLLVQLPRQGYAILNIDDPLVATMAEKTVAQVITYGSSRTADIRLVRAKRLQQGIALEIDIDNTSHELYLAQVASTDQALSALAGLAVAKALKLDIQKAGERLAKLTPAAGQLKLIAALHNTHLLDASYDATPEDMLAALDALDDMPSKRKIAILALFNNLANQTHYWNELLATTAGKIADITILVGHDIPEARKAALAAGSDIHHFQTSNDAGKWLADFLQTGDAVLVNGPQEERLEEAVWRLLPEQDRNHMALARKVRFA